MEEKNIESHSGHKSGEEIYNTQEFTRKKNESEFNVYLDKKEINKSSEIIFIIMSIILLVILLIIIF